MKYILLLFTLLSTIGYSQHYEDFSDFNRNDFCVDSCWGTTTGGWNITNDELRSSNSTNVTINWYTPRYDFDGNDTIKFSYKGTGGLGDLKVKLYGTFPVSDGDEWFTFTIPASYITNNYQTFHIPVNISGNYWIMFEQEKITNARVHMDWFSMTKTQDLNCGVAVNCFNRSPYPTVLDRKESNKDSSDTKKEEYNEPKFYVKDNILYTNLNSLCMLYTINGKYLGIFSIKKPYPISNNLNIIVISWFDEIGSRKYKKIIIK